MSDFEDRARAAGRGLGALAPTSIDPALPRQRLRRRRIVAASTAFVVVAGIGGGVALARNDHDRHNRVHAIGPDSTTTVSESSTTTEPETSSTIPATTTTAAPSPTTTTVPLPTWSGPPVVCVIDGDVVGVSVDGAVPVTHNGGYTLAYLVNAGEIWGRTDSVIIKPANNLPMHTIPDMTLVGAGTFKGHDVAITLDLHPDVLHDNWKWISLYDFATGTLTRTQLSIAPGSTLDHVSIAGDLFVMSGFSSEGGPFVLYRHIDGSFDNNLPNVVGGNLSIGKVTNAVISPDGTRIAYLVSGQLAVNDVQTGKVLERVSVTDRPYFAASLDFDGRWAVISRAAVPSSPGVSAPEALAVDTQAAQPAPVELANTAGATTIVPQ